jgi:hypothetical protein
MHKQLGNYNIILIIRCLVTDINKPVIVVSLNIGGAQNGGLLGNRRLRQPRRPD